jgi:hypothetical protein
VFRQPTVIETQFIPDRVESIAEMGHIKKKPGQVGCVSLPLGMRQDMARHALSRVGLAEANRQAA